MARNATVQLYLNLSDLGKILKVSFWNKIKHHFTSEKVEMTEKVVIYQPYEAEQILLAENASCLAVKTYLKMLDREFVVRSCSNAEFMAPSGKRTKLPVVQIGAFLAAEFEPIINLMEHKKLSLTENFSGEDKDELVT